MNLFEAWSRETSSDPKGWTEANPAYGQCAVTALVIQDTLGGELLRSVINGVSHYWNRLPNGQEFDMTIQQFGMINSREETTVRGRDYVLSFPETAKRYQILKNKMVNDK
jgi:hypothetical protein